MSQHSADVLTLADWTVSGAELQQAIKFVLQHPKTKEVEKQGKALARNFTAPCSFQFSKAVCKDWAGNAMGRWVWTTLKGHHKNDDALGEKLCTWFQAVKRQRFDVEEAIQRGIDIKGLGVSFASKHLRLLWPQRFGVLDSVLSEELGFALNVAGYKLFLRMLREFKEQYSFKKENLGTLEMAIYRCIQDQRKAAADR